MTYRPSPRTRGYTTTWDKYSREYRARHPMCVRCKYSPSDCVDHIAPVSGADDPLFWAPDNHQALCHRCHSVKTVEGEEAGAWKRTKLGCDEHGVPHARKR